MSYSDLYDEAVAKYESEVGKREALVAKYEAALRERDEARAEAAKHRVTDALAEPLAILDDQMIAILEGQRDRQKARAESAEAEVARQREALANARGLMAECLALNPSVSGDMEKVRVWSDTARRMREEAALQQQPQAQEGDDG